MGKQFSLVKLWAIGLSALLIFAMFAMLPQAHAQTTGPVGGIENWLQVNFSDGTHCLMGVATNLGSLTGGGCNHAVTTISSFDFLLMASIPNNVGAIPTQSSISATVYVLNRDGTYHQVPVTGGYTQPPSFYLDTGLITYWQLYASHATTAQVESAMGTGLSNYAADVRLASGIGFVYLKYNSGQTIGYSASSQVAVYSLTQLGTSSGGGGGGCIGTSCPVTPTGRIYPVVTVHYVDGSTSVQLPNSPQNFTSASFVLLSDQNPKNVTSMDWELRLFVANDVFSLPRNYNGFLDPASTSNFGVTVGAQSPAMNWNNQINKISTSGTGATYHLMDMAVQESAITPLLTPISGTQYGQGILSFSVAPATLTFTSTTGTYPVSVQSWLTQYNLLGTTATGGTTTGPCDISNLVCQANQAVQGFITQVAKMLNVSDETAEIILAILIGGIIIIGLAMIRAKKGKKAFSWNAL